MMVDEVVIARAPVADWDRAEREARHAAALVATFVGVPAALAAGAALIVFALTWLVLLAPLVAAVLTWTAWRYGRPEPRRHDPA
jgi:membrane protein implicated in regulation of membrane protease activity